MKYLYLIPRFWKTILVLAIIYFLCLIPANDIGKIDFLKIKYEDSIVHVMMFLGFSAMLFLDLQRNTHLANNIPSLCFTVLIILHFAWHYHRVAATISDFPPTYRKYYGFSF